MNSINKTGRLVSVFALLLATQSAFAANPFTSKVNDFIHTVYFNTPNNQTVNVHMTAAFGQLVNSNCQYNKSLDFGMIPIGSNDNGPVTVVGFNSDILKLYVGNGYTCGKFDFTYKQTAEDKFSIAWDAQQQIYTSTTPATTTIKIQ